MREPESIVLISWISNARRVYQYVKNQGRLSYDNVIMSQGLQIFFPFSLKGLGTVQKVPKFVAYKLFYYIKDRIGFRKKIAKCAATI